MQLIAIINCILIKIVYHIFMGSIESVPPWTQNIIDTYSPVSRQKVQEYGRDVMALLHQIEGCEKTPDDCEISIQIPAYCKERNLKQTLLHYAQQFPWKWPHKPVVEIIVNINGPSAEDIENSEALKDCREAYKQYPYLNICIVKQIVPQKDFKIGRIRGVTAMVSAKRAMENPNVNLKDMVVITNDADLKWLSPNYISSIWQYFKTYPHINAAGTFINYPDFQVTSNHLGIVVQRCEEMLEIIDKRKHGHMILRSWSSAYRMESLLSAWTFPNARKWESGQLVRNIKKKSGQNSVGLIPKHLVHLTTSARRHATAVLTGTKITDRYTTFGTAQDLAVLYHDGTKREEARKTVVIVQDSDYVTKLENELQEVYNKRIRAHMKDATRVSEADADEEDLSDDEVSQIKKDTQSEFTKISPFIGIKFDFPDDDTLKISDIGRLEENLRKRFSVLD
jgi:hypothetical protein